MKSLFSSSILLRIRNTFHAVLPGLCEKIESARKAEHFRRTIALHGFVLPFPPFIKRSILLRFVLDHGCRTLVETGTQYGDTPWFFRNKLEEIYTIELSARLAKLARARFAKFPHIHVVEGDSGAMIKTILPALKSKTLFWLDGHYSSGITAQGKMDCPIYSELQSIFDGCGVPYVILIDDARCFGKEKDYPSLGDLETFLSKKFKKPIIEINNDIICIIPD